MPMSSNLLAPIRFGLIVPLLTAAFLYGSPNLLPDSFGTTNPQTAADVLPAITSMATVAVTTGPISQRLHGEGKYMATKVYDLTFEGNGNFLSYSAHLYDSVAKDDVIALCTPNESIGTKAALTDLAEQLSAAATNVQMASLTRQSAQDTLDLAIQQYEDLRQKPLPETDDPFTDEQNRDDRKQELSYRTEQITMLQSQLHIAELALAQQRQQLENLQNKRNTLGAENAMLRAPWDGYLISTAPFKEGMKITPSAVVATMVRREDVVFVLSMYQTATWDSLLQVSMELEGQQHKATLLSQMPEGTPLPASGSGRIYLQLDTLPDMVRWGGTLPVTLTVWEEDALLLPVEAVTRAGRRSTVLLQSAVGTVVTDVVTGISDGEYIQIVSGLSPGNVVYIAQSEAAV